ncbi:hypothetical protein HYH03_000817 [Edaphochlamys debaryana]|uniref:Uncharacterized protein n=1 Tax=Edaphochlamys debaryana TaxID=47281 RepID=A0A836C5K5_9CHLO|nr:hypothetical protein HYH03_000817 [Edaphochlamys debaryana]|eukprot:KAG2500995.1 hypothetical protein HYH03_000817 [Edaphochlamys debaryana]
MLARLAHIASPAVAPRRGDMALLPRSVANYVFANKQPARQVASTPAVTYSEPTPAPAQAPAPAASGTPRFVPNWSIYKTKSAMAVRLIPPTFVASPNGSYQFVDRDGTMLLEFANANSSGPVSPGANRTYNWGNKVTFALSATELGNILASDLGASKEGLTLFHDPVKLGKTGEPLKKLNIKAFPDGNINMAVTAGPDNVSVIVSKAEFEIFKSVAHFAIPRLFGFDKLF